MATQKYEIKVIFWVLAHVLAIVTASLDLWLASPGPPLPLRCRITRGVGLNRLRAMIPVVVASHDV